MAVEGQNHRMFAGETPTFTVGPVKNKSTGAIIDLTSATITWVVVQATPPYSTIFTKTVGSGITVASPTTGYFTITLTSSNTDALSGDYRHECRVVLADSTEAVIFTGSLVVMPTLTG